MSFKTITNSERAAIAAKHVRAFKKETCPGESNETAAADLVCNILHYMRLEYDVESLQEWLFYRLDTHNEEANEDSDN